MTEVDQRSRLFGTDGVRGIAGRDLTARLALDLSVAAAAVLGRGATQGSASQDGDAGQDGAAGRDGAARQGGAATQGGAAKQGGAAGQGGGASQGGSCHPVAVVGRDPRASGEFLEAAVVAGLASAGIDVLRLGVIPTPGVAYLTRALDAAIRLVTPPSPHPARGHRIQLSRRAAPPH